MHTAHIFHVRPVGRHGNSYDIQKIHSFEKAIHVTRSQQPAISGPADQEQPTFNSPKPFSGYLPFLFCQRDRVLIQLGPFGKVQFFRLPVYVTQWKFPRHRHPQSVRRQAWSRIHAEVLLDRSTRQTQLDTALSVAASQIITPTPSGYPKLAAFTTT
jgi:hypothetical protein